MKKVLLLICFMPLFLMAQETQFWGNAERYLQRQGSHFLNQIDEALDANKPDTNNSLVRRQALYNMDAILHNTFYDKSDELKAFMANRVGKVIADMKGPQGDGMKIYKLYNDGFIARAGGATVAFDIISGLGLINDEQLEQLVSQCDILCLTHNHPDHTDAKVVNLFISQGKKVFATKEILPDVQGVTHLYEGTGGEITMRKEGDVTLHIVHGHQDDLQNNLYVVTLPGNFTVCQTGDQYLEEDMPWIKTLHTRLPKVDALLVICWSMHLQDFVNGFQPKVVIS